WKIKPKPTTGDSGPRRIDATLEKTTLAVNAESRPLPLVPKPKERTLAAGYLQLGREFTAELEGPAAEMWERAEEMIWQRWNRSSFVPAAQPAKVTASIRSLGLQPEGYEIRVGADGIQLIGQSEAGLRNAFQ